MLNYENATDRCSVYLTLNTYPLTPKDQPVYAVWAIIDVIVSIMKRNKQVMWKKWIVLFVNSGGKMW